MSDFLRENWVWIVAPIVVLILALVVVTLSEADTDDGQFIYTIG